MAVYIIFSVFFIVGIDQLLKYFIVSNVKYIGESINIIPNFLNIVYVENKGAAFGILQNQRWFFIVFSILLIAIFIYLIFYKNFTNKIFLMSSVLIVGGGIGNLIDRIKLGYVIDYLQLSFFPPVCNFADYCISFGTAILIIYILFLYNKKEINSFKDEFGE